MRTERRAIYRIGVDNAETAVEEIKEAFAFLDHFTRTVGSYVDYYEDSVSVAQEINDAFSLADSHESIEIVYIYDMAPDEEDGMMVYHYEMQVYVLHTDDDNFCYSTKINAKANGEFTHEEEKTHGKEN